MSRRYKPLSFGSEGEFQPSSSYGSDEPGPEFIPQKEINELKRHDRASDDDDEAREVRHAPAHKMLRVASPHSSSELGEPYDGKAEDDEMEVEDSPPLSQGFIPIGQQHYTATPTADEMLVDIIDDERFPNALTMLLKDVGRGIRTDIKQLVKLKQRQTMFNSGTLPKSLRRDTQPRVSLPGTLPDEDRAIDQELREIQAIADAKKAAAIARHIQTVYTRLEDSRYNHRAGALQTFDMTRAKLQGAIDAHLFASIEQTMHRALDLLVGRWYQEQLEKETRLADLKLISTTAAQLQKARVQDKVMDEAHSDPEGTSLRRFVEDLVRKEVKTQTLKPKPKPKPKPSQPAKLGKGRGRSKNHGRGRGKGKTYKVVRPRKTNNARGGKKNSSH